MKIVISNERVEFNGLKPFTPIYDKVYLSFDEEKVQENNDFIVNEKNIKKLFNIINYSWDGEIYFFTDKDNVLQCLDDWFKNEKNHVDIEDYGISNCFLIKYTPNGICLIDTQLDMSSNITAFLEELNERHPKITYEYYSGSHLIDNIKLGADSINNEFDILYLLYKEKVIDSSFFLNGISSFTIDDEDSEYNLLLEDDKEIVITGKLACEREEVLNALKEAGYKFSNKVTLNSWLWYGEKVGANKIKAAKGNNILCNSIDEVIEQAYQKYLKNKSNLNKRVKP